MYTKEIQDWINAGGVIKKIPPKESIKKLDKINGGYFKPQSVMGPSKSKGKLGKTS